jgi:hypothetical protein
MFIRKTGFVVLVMVITPWLVTNVHGVGTTYRMDREGEQLIKRSDGTRIDRNKIGKCKDCAEKEAARKSLYLERVLLAEQSTSYQKLIEQQILSDKKFVAKCWNSNSDKGIEVFFSVAKTGVVDDIAWFPNQRSAKCIKKHLKGIEFPRPDEEHHAWVVVNEEAMAD